jgi:hypothetical protein
VVEAHGIDTKRKVMEIFIFGSLSHENKSLKYFHDKWIKDDGISLLILLESNANHNIGFQSASICSQFTIGFRNKRRDEIDDEPAF